MRTLRQRWRRLRDPAGGRLLGDVFPARAVAPAPTVILVHGGFWKWPYDRGSMLLLARDAHRRGWAVVNVRYRRLGRLGGGGGWPATFDDVRSALGAIRSHHDVVDLSRVVLVGHSAGAQLALWAAGEHVLAVRGVVSLAGVTDLKPGWTRGASAIRRLLAGSPADRRFELTSPRQRIPLGVPVVCIHSVDDTTVRPSMSTSYVEAARLAGDVADLVEVSAETHRDALRPSSATWGAAIDHIAWWFDA